MKITKRQLRKIIKEEKQRLLSEQPRTIIDTGDPFGPDENLNVMQTLEGMGYVLTRGGKGQLEDFLRDLEAQGDMTRKR